MRTSHVFSAYYPDAPNRTTGFIGHAAAPRGKMWGAMLMLGLWLRAGFVGAMLLVIALMQLGDRNWPPVAAPALALAAGALMAASWRFGRRLLDRIDPPAVETAVGVTSPSAVIDRGDSAVGSSVGQLGTT